MFINSPLPELSAIIKTPKTNKNRVADWNCNFKYKDMLDKYYLSKLYIKT